MNWNRPLPEITTRTRLAFRNGMNSPNQLHISRFPITAPGRTMVLHGFSDASLDLCCSRLWHTQNCDGHIHVAGTWMELNTTLFLAETLDVYPDVTRPRLDNHVNGTFRRRLNGRRRLRSLRHQRLSFAHRLFPHNKPIISVWTDLANIGACWRQWAVFGIGLLLDAISKPFQQSGHIN